MKRVVLIVDDDKVNRRILRKILEDGYAVIEAENGEEALDILRAEKERVSAVLLDIVMPVMDGYAFLDAVKADRSLALIPIIVTTQNDGDESEVESLSRGASDFLAKPYKPLIIRHRLANIIKNRESAALINAIERDSLTGLYSKEFFEHTGANILASKPDAPFDIVYVNVERFKLVNDLYGMNTGNNLLRHVASSLDAAFSSTGMCCRLNADQFAVLVPRTGDIDRELSQVADEIRAFDQRMDIAVKFGIFEVEDRDLPFGVMCDRARLAIDSIKGMYGLHCARYDESIRNRMLLEQALTASMDEALKTGQFEMYLQPKYEFSTERIIGAEALVRWIHPEKGFLSPATFVPLFEKNGFVTKLDFYIWEEACKKLRALLDERGSAVPISVNVSRADLYLPDLPERLLSLTRRYGLDPRLLHLEITETAYACDSTQICKMADELKSSGFVIEMDDFGTGYSSLNMLSELPIDVLKIDMRFLQMANDDRNSAVLLEFVIELARSLDLAVVAEGVETEAQARMLRDFGCDCAQGYLFARPMPAPQFDALLDEPRGETRMPLDEKDA